MIKNILIPSFKTLEEGIKFMSETEYNTLFSVGVNWDLWFNVNGEEFNNIEEQKDSVIISQTLPNDIITQNSDFEVDKWYYDGNFIVMMI